MAAAKGHRPPAAGMGRKKGSQNKITRAFKEAILNVYNDMGGDETFLEWAAANKTEFYKIASRLIPHDIQHSGEIKLPTVVDELH